MRAEGKAVLKTLVIVIGENDIQSNEFLRASSEK